MTELETGERGHVRDAEHLVQRVMGGGVQLLVLVQQRVDERDPVAGGAVAVLPCLPGEELQGTVVQLVQPALVGAGQRGHGRDPEQLEQAWHVQPRLQPG